MFPLLLFSLLFIIYSSLICTALHLPSVIAQALKRNLNPPKCCKHIRRVLLDHTSGPCNTASCIKQRPIRYSWEGMQVGSGDSSPSLQLPPSNCCSETHRLLTRRCLLGIMVSSHWCTLPAGNCLVFFLKETDENGHHIHWQWVPKVNYARNKKTPFFYSLRAPF